MLKAIEIRSKEGEARRLAALRTPEVRQKIGLAAKLNQSSPEYKQEQSKRMKLILANPEVRKRISEGTKKGWTLQARAKMSCDRTGHLVSQETREKIRQALLNVWSNPENRERILSNTTSLETNEKRRQSMLGKKCTLEHRRKVSEASKRQWQDPKIKDKMIKGWLKGIQAKPNKAERKLNEIIQSIQKKEYALNVRGNIMILGGKVPDFVNINGKKRLIELYGNYFHKDENPNDRIKYFRKFGYNTLIIWESELANKEKLAIKVRKWLEVS